MGFIEGIRGRREASTPSPEEIISAQETILASRVLEDARESAKNVLDFFTRGPRAIKIDSKVSCVLEYLITERLAPIPDEESPVASKNIQKELDKRYMEIIEQEIESVHPKKRAAIPKAHNFLRRAADTMIRTYTFDLSLPEEDEARKEVLRLVKQYNIKMGRPIPRQPAMTSRLFSYAAVAAVGCASMMGINTIKAMEQERPATRPQSAGTSPEASGVIFEVQPPQQIHPVHLGEEFQLITEQPLNWPTATVTPKFDK